MNKKNQIPKKEFQLLGKIKPATKRAVWISSAFVTLFTLGLMFAFNFSDIDNIFAADSGKNQQTAKVESKTENITDKKSDPAATGTLKDEPTNQGKGTLPGDESKSNKDFSTEENIDLNNQLKRIENNTGNEGLMDVKIISYGPNPFTDKLNVVFIQQVDFDVDFEIINSSGVAVYIDIINGRKGVNQYEFIDNNKLPKGTYYLVLLYNHKRQVRKLIKN